MSNTAESITHIDCETILDPKHLNYSWTISRYLMHTRRKQKLQSPVFSASDDGFRWYLQHFISTFPSSCGQYTEEFVTLQLIPDYEDDDLKKFGVVSGGVELSIMKRDTKAVTQLIRFRIAAEDVYDRYIGVSKFILLEDMKKWVFDETLTIFCSIGYVKNANIITSLKSQPLSANRAIPMQMFESNVLKDLEQLLSGRYFADLTISVKGKNYPVHRSILAARSSFFKTMFTSNTREARSNHIVINDIEQNVFEEVLHFIYTGKAKNLQTFSYELLSAADKYDLKDLRSMCKEVVSFRSYENML